MRRRKPRLLQPAEVVAKDRTLARGRYSHSGALFSNSKDSKVISAATKLRPFILTCDLRIDTFEKFVNSYLRVKSCMLKPVVIMDDTNTVGDERNRYHDLIIKLDPHVVINQPHYSLESLKEWDPFNVDGKMGLNYYNVQRLMVDHLPHWALQYSDGPAIFMEDDIYLSSRFPSGIAQCSQYIGKEADFITLYANERYKTYNKFKTYSFMHPINGNDYYGNLCLVFSRKVLLDLANNGIKVKEVSNGILKWKFAFAFDIRWGTYMQSKGYRMYETNLHYVRHLEGLSAIEGDWKPVYGGNFLE